MESAVPQHLKIRKTPIQARSGATVEAINEATIQVLLADGLTRLTTTRVAHRAGVSVGTLYQYFPNKQALLFAILQAHFEEMAAAIECIDLQNGKVPLSELADSIADAYVSVKESNPDATRALYRVAGAIDQARLSPDIFSRLEAATVRLLKNASDASFSDPIRTAFTLLAALSGLSRASFARLEAGFEVLERLREESRIFARAYLLAAQNATPSHQGIGFKE
ncbi:TetR/AcrR family transcriptional regulator [Novosphingobium terrae]|uniref:TetR/AcrR family transcriptional regulator n=1 Tax=Novosphingobium terrae TaxID=2726189 RepID=UPI0019821B7D|nr:TetR/AcrR family transcriptional regulator [Novosphingobium terrae]